MRRSWVPSKDRTNTGRLCSAGSGRIFLAPKELRGCIKEYANLLPGSEQTESLERLAGHRFEWVLAGHGGSAQRPAEEMCARLLDLVAWMREQ